ncbi:hypothetical protein REPUB_Repub05bG0006200 [Reevesia pubescens]
MSIFAGNLGFKISTTLQFRVFSIPWNKAIFCLKEREYSSSVPVRYIPKKYLETEEPETSPNSKGLIKNESHKSCASNAFGSMDKNNRRSIVDKESQTRSRTFKKNVLYDDVGQDHETTEKPVGAVEEMHLGHDIHGKNMLHVSKGMPDAEKLAIELLAARAFTAVELRKKLLGKRFHPDIVEAVINDFKNRCVTNHRKRHHIEYFCELLFWATIFGSRFELVLQLYSIQLYLLFLHSLFLLSIVLRVKQLFDHFSLL